ncbi:MAG: hypothetical protein RLY21_144 [Planctomycetota bacterium]|jgi:hypothetical protein
MTAEEIPQRPPTQSWIEPGDEDLQARRARWRMVFCSLSLFVAVMGVLMQGMGAAMVLFGHRIWATSGIALPEPPSILAWAAIVQFVVLSLLGVLLLTGATMLIRRNPTGRTLVLGWAVARLVMAMIGIGIGLMTIKPQVEWQTEIIVAVRESMRAQPGVNEGSLPPLPERGQAEATALRSLGVATLFFVSWPFVMAIVLTRPFVKEEIEEWRRDRAMQA